MSGGHFNYEDQRLTQCIDQLKKDLRKAKKAVKPDSEYDTYYFHYESEETFQFVKKLIKRAEKLRKALHEYDWFISGDTDEEFFLEKYKEIYQKKNNKKADGGVHYLTKDECIDKMRDLTPEEREQYDKFLQNLYTVRKQL